MRIFLVGLVVVLAGCTTSVDQRAGRGCPEGYEYRVAPGVQKVSWRDYCLSADGSEAVDPHWIYEGE